MTAFCKELSTPDTGTRGSNSSEASTSSFPDVAVVAAAVASVGLSFIRGKDPVGAEVWRGLSLTGEEPFGADAAEVSSSLQSR